MTSLPTPSPGIHAMRYFATSSSLENAIRNPKVRVSPLSSPARGGAIRSGIVASRVFPEAARHTSTCGVGRQDGVERAAGTRDWIIWRNGASLMPRIGTARGTNSRPRLLQSEVRADMNVRIGIMGFGRIGRNIFRIVYPRDDIEVRAIVDVADPKGLEYLLKFDTVHGRFRDPVSVVGSAMYVKGRQIQMITAREPGEVDWGALGVDVVIEATGQIPHARDAHPASGPGRPRGHSVLPAQDARGRGCPDRDRGERRCPRRFASYREQRLLHHQRLAPILRLLGRQLRSGARGHDLRARLHQCPSPGRRPRSRSEEKSRRGGEHHSHLDLLSRGDRARASGARRQAGWHGAQRAGARRIEHRSHLPTRA